MKKFTKIINKSKTFAEAYKDVGEGKSSEKILEKYYFQGDTDLESIKKRNLWFKEALKWNKEIQFLQGCNLLEDGNIIEGKSYLQRAAKGGVVKSFFFAS